LQGALNNTLSTNLNVDGEFGPLTEAAVVQALGQFLNQQEALVKLARAIDWGTFGAGYTDNNAADGGAGDPQAHLRPEPLSFVPLHTMRSPDNGKPRPCKRAAGGTRQPRRRV